MRPEQSTEIWLQKYRDEYMTLQEVGDFEGVSREAIRLRLNKLGITPRSSQETHDLARERALTAHGSKVMEGFLQSRSVKTTAEALNIRLSWVQYFVERNIPDSSVLQRAPRAANPRFSNTDLISSLREAAASTEGNLSSAGYSKFVAEHPSLEDGRPRPGSQVMALRYGSWISAMAAANLSANPHSGPEKTFTSSEAVSSVVDCWRELGKPPTASSYDQWQRGKDHQPSAATVRNSAGPWNALLIRAWQLVHGIQLDQNDENSLLPSQITEEELSARNTLLVPYRAAEPGVEVSMRSTFTESEYNSLERAVQSHARLQNLVALAADKLGYKAVSPTLSSPQFDVAIPVPSDVILVVEVKSATPENLELQLRIALGQVLRYCGILSSMGQNASPAIAIEIPPPDSWKELLIKLGVSLLVQGSEADDLARILKALSDSRSGQGGPTSINA